MGMVINSLDSVNDDFEGDSGLSVDLDESFCSFRCHNFLDDFVKGLELALGRVGPTLNYLLGCRPNERHGSSEDAEGCRVRRKPRCELMHGTSREPCACV
jgi:hypothetical protein